MLPPSALTEAPPAVGAPRIVRRPGARSGAPRSRSGRRRVRPPVPRRRRSPGALSVRPGARSGGGRHRGTGRRSPGALTGRSPASARRRSSSRHRRPPVRPPPGAPGGGAHRGARRGPPPLPDQGADRPPPGAPRPPSAGASASALTGRSLRRPGARSGGGRHRGTGGAPGANPGALRRPAALSRRCSPGRADRPPPVLSPSSAAALSPGGVHEKRGGTEAPPRSP